VVVERKESRDALLERAIQAGPPGPARMAVLAPMLADILKPPFRTRLFSFEHDNLGDRPGDPVATDKGMVSEDEFFRRVRPAKD
jgi:hypothetical protein